jgi:predicted ATPase
VVGDAGSGKSRLLWELKHRLEGDGVVFFEGRCSSINQMVPYYPMLSMLRHFFELGPDDSREVAQQRFRAKFGDKAKHVGLTYPILTRLLSMPAGSQVDVPPDGFAREISDGITELVLGEQGPVIVTLEDLHWIDDASRDLLGTLLKRLAGAPVLVVVTHRPDGEPKWRVPRGVETIRLNRLSAGEVTEILRAVAGVPLPAELEGTLVNKAAGSRSLRRSSPARSSRATTSSEAAPALRLRGRSPRCRSPGRSTRSSRRGSIASAAPRSASCRWRRCSVASSARRI